MFVRPTLPELVTRIEQDLISRLELVGSAMLRRAVARVLARVVAGAAHMMHGHLEFIAAQLFADTATGTFLVRLARLFGIDRTPAEFATGNATITGTNGTVIPIGTVLQRADGSTYTTNIEVTIALLTATVAVTAEIAGALANADAGAALAFESPIAGADATVLVAVGGLSDGTDEELDEALRVRLIARMRNPPMGGSASDYEAWALEVPGVTRAWVYPLELGAGTVVVRFVRDNDVGSIIPSGGEVTAVQTHIGLKRPVTAAVTVSAPTAAPLNYTVHIVPDNSTTRAAVTAELTDLLARGEPGVTVLLSQNELAVGNAAGVTDFTLTVPAADVAHATGALATLGTITWVP